MHPSILKAHKVQYQPRAATARKKLIEPPENPLAPSIPSSSVAIAMSANTQKVS